MIQGPVYIEIDDRITFSKPIPYQWKPGSIRIAKVRPELWDTIKTREPQSLAEMNLWVAANPKQFCDLKELADIRVLSINSPFAQASQRGDKDGENFGLPSAFYPGQKTLESKIPDHPKCKLCVLPHLFKDAPKAILDACVCYDWDKSNPNNRWERRKQEKLKEKKSVLLIPKYNSTTIKPKTQSNSKSKSKPKSQSKSKSNSKSKSKSKRKGKSNK